MPGSAVPRRSSGAAPSLAIRRRLPVGAEYGGQGWTHIRVWAPAAECVEVVVDASAVHLDAEGSGYFSGVISAGAGDRYRFRLGGTDRLYPDPASRFQPEGPHGPSEIVDPGSFAWSDGRWRGRSLEGQVIYEVHVGTFTPEGTWTAAMRELGELARLGVTTIEVMPVAEFEGRFGWGYDGVDVFAPTHTYGVPNDFRRFVDAAHRLGLAVILDVVYNHLGPGGELPSRVLAGVLFRPVRQRVGRRDQLRRRRCGPGEGVLHRKRRLLDR